MPSSLPCTPALRRLAARCAHKAQQNVTQARVAARFGAIVLCLRVMQLRSYVLYDAWAHCLQSCDGVVITQFPPPQHETTTAARSLLKAPRHQPWNAPDSQRLPQRGRVEELDISQLAKGRARGTIPSIASTKAFVTATRTVLG